MSNIKFVKKEEKSTNLLNYILVGFIVILGVSIYLMLGEKSNIRIIKYNEFLSKSKENDYTVFLLAIDGCTHCQMYKPIVNEIAKMYDFEAFYLDVDEITKDEFDYLHDNVSALMNEYSDDDEPVIPTPTTIIFKDGQEVASKIGNIGKEGFINLLVDSGVIKK